MQTFQARLTENQQLTGNFWLYHFELLDPHRIEFIAGQYVILTVDREKGVRRDYSITSAPSIDHAIDLLNDLTPQGPGSVYLKNLKIGDQVEFVGPFGNFVIDTPVIPASEPGPRQGTSNEIPHQVRDDSSELVFVATGSGIAPIRSMLLEQLVTKRTMRPIRLWWGMRYQEDCFWVEEFDQLEREHPNFKWDLVLSRPPEGWPLHTGHVTEHVLSYSQNMLTTNSQHLTTNSFYLCGSREMIEELAAGLGGLGVNKEQIYWEKFF